MGPPILNRFKGWGIGEWKILMEGGGGVYRVVGTEGVILITQTFLKAENNIQLILRSIKSKLA